MADLRIEITGLDEIEAKLRELDTSAEQHIVLTGVQAATRVLGEAVEAATPEDSGLTKAHLGVNIRRKGRFTSGVVGFGNRGYIARLVEFGHRIVGHRPGLKDTGKRVKAKPFMRQAFDASNGKAVEAFEQRVEQGIARAVRKKR